MDPHAAWKRWTTRQEPILPARPNRKSSTLAWQVNFVGCGLLASCPGSMRKFLWQQPNAWCNGPLTAKLYERFSEWAKGHNTLLVQDLFSGGWGNDANAAAKRLQQPRSAVARGMTMPLQLTDAEFAYVGKSSERRAKAKIHHEKNQGTTAHIWTEGYVSAGVRATPRHKRARRSSLQCRSRRAPPRVFEPENAEGRNLYGCRRMC